MKKRTDRRGMFYGAGSVTFETARILRKNMTLPELILWQRLRNKDLFTIKFRRQHPVNVFIVDFYCHELKLVIEIDGEIHQEQEKKMYDDGRTAEMERLGIKVLRFSNHEVIYQIDSVINRIHNIITELAPLQGGPTPQPP